MSDALGPHFAVDLTPGEKAMFAKIEREQAVHNAIGAKLGAFRDQIYANRNAFVGELCKKYGVKKPSEITYDPRTQRLVSVFSAGLVAVKIDRSPEALDETAAEMVQAAIRELLAIYKATQEAQSAAERNPT